MRWCPLLVALAALGPSASGQTLAETARVQMPEGPIRALAFSADGRLLAASGGDDRVRLLSLPSGDVGRTRR